MHGATMKITLGSLKLLLLYEAVTNNDFAYSRKKSDRNIFICLLYVIKPVVLVTPKSIHEFVEHVLYFVIEPPGIYFDYYKLSHHLVAQQLQKCV